MKLNLGIRINVKYRFDNYSEGLISRFVIKYKLEAVQTSEYVS